MSRPRWLGRALALVALGVWGMAACNGPKLATIPLSDFGVPSEVPITVAPGSELGFVFAVDHYSFKGRNGVSVDFELKKGATVVATEGCPIFSTGKGDSGCGSHSSSRNRGCKLLVPPGGADRIRATAKLNAPSGDFEAKGMSVSIHGAR